MMDKHRVMARRFVWDDGEDSRYGSPGWLPKWIKNAPEFDPSYGLGVAHDFMEHRLADTGMWHNEVMAFGAMIHTRMLGGFFSGAMASRGLTSDELGEELSELYIDNCLDDTWIKPIDTRLITPNLNLTDAGYHIGQMMRGLRDGFDHALDHQRMSESQRPTGYWYECVEFWLKQGYMQAKTRYHGLDSYTLSEAFQQIMQTVDKKTGKGREFYEELEVRLNLYTGEPQVFLVDNYRS